MSELIEVPIRFYPTTVRFPSWVGFRTIKLALSRLNISEPKVKLISEKFELERGLSLSPYKPNLKPTLNPLEILDSIKVEAPVDGTEVVEWMQICLPNGHSVVTEGGFKDISEVNVGEKVLTHNGGFETVTRVFRRPYKGKLVGLKLVGYPDNIWLTPEHPVLVGVKELKGSGYRKREWSTWWIKAGEINVPIEKVMNDAYKRRFYALLPIPKIENGTVKPTKALARFIGYYLSEGCTYHRKKYRSYVVDLSNSNDRIIEDMSKCIEDAFGKDPYVGESGNGAQKVTFWSKGVHLWLKENFGANCYDKQVPSWLLGWPTEYIKEVLDAYWLGDGSSQPRRGYNRLAYHTVSKNLALGLRLLELKLGRETTICRRGNPSAYIVYVNNQEDREGYPQVRLVDGYLWMPVENIETKEYDGYVYNLEVEGSNSYVVETMSVHNCAAENVVLQARIAEYNRLGSELAGANGDGYIPGVVVEDIKFQSQSGTTVSSQGYAIATTPRGNFNVPSLKKAPGVFKDLISWGSMSYLGALQFNGTLLKWKSLAETPINQTVGFYMDTRGNVAPNFFVQQPTRPALTVTVTQVFSSDQSQTLKLNFRDPTDYSRIVGSKNVSIASGTSQVSYTVSAFPYVVPLICEIQPQDSIQTKLESYTVT